MGKSCGPWTWRYTKGGDNLLVMRKALVRGKEWWYCHARCLAQGQMDLIELEGGL